MTRHVSPRTALPCSTSSGSATIPRRWRRRCTKRGSAPEAARATVDGLIAMDEARRAQIVKVEEAQARRNAASKEIGKAKAREGRGDRRGADGRGRGAEDLPRHCRGRGQAARQGAGGCARRHPQRAVRRRAGRPRRARQCREEPLGQAADPQQRQGALRARRGARDDGLRDGGEAVRLALRRAQEGPRPHGAGARPVHARPPHHRARLRGDPAAAAGAGRDDVRHGAAAEVRRRSVPRDPDRSTESRARSSDALRFAIAERRHRTIGQRRRSTSPTLRRPHA